MGSCLYDFVRVGNLLCARTAMLLWLASSLGVRWLLEQPSGSLVPDMPRIQELYEKVAVPWKICDSGFQFRPWTFDGGLIVLPFALRYSEVGCGWVHLVDRPPSATFCSATTANL